MAASPKETGPSVSHACWIVGPPLRRIAPATPAPSCRRVLAAFTTASTSASVISPCSRITFDFQLIRAASVSFHSKLRLPAELVHASCFCCWRRPSCCAHVCALSAQPAGPFWLAPERQGAPSPSPATGCTAVKKRLTYQKEYAIGSHVGQKHGHHGLPLPRTGSARAGHLRRRSRNGLQS